MICNYYANALHETLETSVRESLCYNGDEMVMKMVI